MVSATQLASYLYCARKLFLSNVLLIEEPSKAEIVKGRIWHETYEYMNNSEESIVSSINVKDHQEILDLYLKSYSKILRNVIIRNKTKLKEFDLSMIDIFKDYWPNFEKEAKEHALNVLDFINRHDVYGKELWKRLTPKIFSEQKFRSERLNLTGIIDVLEVHDVNGEKSYIPIELKTGKFPDKGMWEGHRIQLGAYMLLLEDAGKNVKEAAIKYKGVDKRSLQMNTFLKDEILSLVKKTDSVLKSLELPPYTDNKNKCKTCPYKEKCYDEKIMAELVDTLKQERKS